MTQIKILNLSALFIGALMLSVLTGAMTGNFTVGISPLFLFWVFLGSQLSNLAKQ